MPLLPYLEQQLLFNEFRLDEPWDSPHNLALLPRMPKVYGVPSGVAPDVRAEASSTYYQVFLGRGTAFEGPDGLRLGADFPDGTADTILLVEAAEAVPWTKPADLAYDADRPLPPLGGLFTGTSRFSLFGANRAKGFHAAFVDGSIRFLTTPVNEKALRQAIVRNDGRPGRDPP